MVPENEATALMKAAVYRAPGQVVTEQVPVPEPGQGEVLISVSYCGICGTDLHMMMEGWGTPGSIEGHEYSGVIAGLGPGVADWSVGEAVVGGPSRGCGRCRWCRDGQPNLCTERPRLGIDPVQGAFAEYKVLAADRLYRVPEGLPIRVAALTEPLAVAYRGVRRSGAGPGDRVLVCGAGPIGALTVAVLRAEGVDAVTASEPLAARRDLAAGMGATEVIEPGDLAVPPLPTDVADSPFQAAIECSGHPQASEAALGCLDRGGTLVLSGTGMHRPRFDSNRIILNELTVTGTVEYGPDDYHAAIALLSERRLPVDLIIEEDDVALADMTAALQRLATGETAGKILVDPHA